MNASESTLSHVEGIDRLERVKERLARLEAAGIRWQVSKDATLEGYGTMHEYYLSKKDVRDLSDEEFEEKLKWATESARKVRSYNRVIPQTDIKKQQLKNNSMNNQPPVAQPAATTQVPNNLVPQAMPMGPAPDQLARDREIIERILSGFKNLNPQFETERGYKIFAGIESMLDSVCKWTNAQSERAFPKQ